MKSPRRIAMAAAVAAALGIAAPSGASANTGVAGADPSELSFVLTGKVHRVTVRPADNASTGYHWQARHSGVLRFLSSRTSRDGKSQVFRFEARRGGNISIDLRYMTPGRRGRTVRRITAPVVVNRPFRVPGCRPKGSRTVVENDQARVFTLRRKVYLPAATEPVAFTGYFGCAFARDRAFGFDDAGSDDPRLSFPTEAQRYTFGTLRGTKFGYALYTRGPELERYNEAHYVVKAIDLERRREVRAARPDLGGPGTNNPVLALLMSDSGGLAWIESPRSGGPIVARSDEPPTKPGGTASDRTVLDSGENGEVDPKSLRLDGGDVTWTRGGALQRAPLR